MTYRRYFVGGLILGVVALLGVGLLAAPPSTAASSDQSGFVAQAGVHFQATPGPTVVIDQRWARVGNPDPWPAPDTVQLNYITSGIGVRVSGQTNRTVRLGVSPSWVNTSEGRGGQIALRLTNLNSTRLFTTQSGQRTFLVGRHLQRVDVKPGFSTTTPSTAFVYSANQTADLEVMNLKAGQRVDAVTASGRILDNATVSSSGGLTLTLPPGHGVIVELTQPTAGGSAAPSGGTGFLGGLLGGLGRLGQLVLSGVVMVVLFLGYLGYKRYVAGGKQSGKTADVDVRWRKRP